MAFDLLADYQAQTSSNSRTENTSSLSQVIEGTAGSAIIGVQIAEDQETSSFAPPDLELPANTVENPDTKQSLDSLAVTPNAPQNPTSDVTDELGPLGRGIIDGLGGLQDASMLGIEVLVVRKWHFAYRMARSDVWAILVVEIGRCRAEGRTPEPHTRSDTSRHCTCGSRCRVFGQ